MLNKWDRRVKIEELIWIINSKCFSRRNLRRFRDVSIYNNSLKASVEEFSSVMESEGTMELAKAMATGQTPAKCLKSWNPLPYGNDNMFIRLWEPDNPSDIEATLGHDMLAMITCDPMEVDEIDWAQVAN